MVRDGERKPLPTRTTGADGVVLVGCFWLIVPLEAQQQSQGVQKTNQHWPKKMLHHFIKFKQNLNLKGIHFN